MKKISTAIAAAALALTAFGAQSVSADNPVPIEDSFSFPDTNPCTNKPMVVTINVVVRVHEHRNNFVLNIKRSGTTDDGFVMRSGAPETQHWNTVSGAAGSQFKDFWTNPDTGQKFHVRGNVNVVFGPDGPDAPPLEVKSDVFSLRCVRA